MSNELLKTGSQTLSTVADVAEDLELVACDAGEMKAAQTAMASWFGAKEEIARKDLADLEASLQTASENGWKIEPLSRQCRNMKKRIQFFEKCRLASEAGYCVIPNLPMTLFAIRTTKPWPKGEEMRRAADVMQRSDAPGPGEGVNVSPDPIVSERWVEEDQAKRTGGFWLFRPDEWDEVEFPVVVRHPRVMDEAAKAMALRVFDEVGIVIDRARFGNEAVTSPRAKTFPKGDPLIVGVIRHPNRSKWDDRKLSFLIAWHIDTTALG